MELEKKKENKPNKKQEMPKEVSNSLAAVIFIGIIIVIIASWRNYLYHEEK